MRRTNLSRRACHKTCESAGEGVHITNPEHLLADIRRSRKRGYFVTRGENIPDVMAIARTCVMDGELLAIAVAGPMHRLEPKLRSIGETLIQTAS